SPGWCGEGAVPCGESGRAGDDDAQQAQHADLPPSVLAQGPRPAAAAGDLRGGLRRRADRGAVVSGVPARRHAALRAGRGLPALLDRDGRRRSAGPQGGARARPRPAAAALSGRRSRNLAAQLGHAAVLALVRAMTVKWSAVAVADLDRLPISCTATIPISRASWRVKSSRRQTSCATPAASPVMLMSPGSMTKACGRSVSRRAAALPRR